MATHRIVESLTAEQISDLVKLYQNEFWCNQRVYPDVVKMLEATSLVIGVVDDRDRLIAFTRVLTDFVYRASLFDVIVKPSHRQQGLGALLLDTVVNHPKLQTIEYFDLFCLPEMIPFYEQWGFSANSTHTLHMRRVRHS